MSDFPMKILHADDEPMIQDIVKRSLKDYIDLEFRICNNGRELINCSRIFKPDLIMLDLKMPVTNGPDVIELLQEEENETPIIIMTGYKDVQMTNAYKNMGVIGVIHKPVSVGILPERIRFFWQSFHKRKNAQ